MDVLDVLDGCFGCWTVLDGCFGFWMDVLDVRVCLGFFGFDHFRLTQNISGKDFDCKLNLDFLDFRVCCVDAQPLRPRCDAPQSTLVGCCGCVGLWDVTRRNRPFV